MALSFEDQPAEKQKLTFKTYREFAKKYWGDNSLPEGVYARSKVYNNFAMMLADQCPWHIVLRVKGDEKTFIGPIFVQMSECLDELKDTTPFVNMFNKVGRYRRFPGVAVQEALVNALIHSDLSMSFEIKVDLTEHLMLITSPGGFMGAEEFEMAMNTTPRNRRMSSLLQRMGFAKLSGDGMNAIKQCYTTSGLVPVIVSQDDCFTVQLPSLDNTAKTFGQGSDTVLMYLMENKRGNIVDLSRQLMISIHRMKMILDVLESDGHILTMGLGSKRTAFYVKTEENELEEMLAIGSDIRLKMSCFVAV